MLRKIVLFTALVALAVLAHGQGPARSKKPLVPPPPAPGSGESLVRVLRTSNKAQTNHFVCDTLTFNNVNPFDLINFFWAVTSREEGGIYSFVNPDGKSGKLVVICPEYQLETLRKLARELDRPHLTSAPGSKYIYYRMRYRNAADPSFRTAVNYWAGTSSVVRPDVETNSMLIFDAPEGADACRAGLEKELDQPLQQVEMGVSLYEVDVNNDGTLGLDFEAWKNGPGKLLGQYRASGDYADVRGGSTHFHTSGTGVYLDYPSSYFDFLVEKGKAKALVQTKITAINRVAALLTTGEQIPYYAVATNTTTSNPNDREVHGTTTPAATASLASPLVRAVNTGITLNVTPVIGKEMVTMALTLSAINNTGFDGAGAPLLSSRSITDSLSVALGDEVIFGGLTRERKVQNARKIPFFGSLPGIGYLFGDETTTMHKTVVVTAINPRVVLGDNNVSESDKSLTKKVNQEEVVVLPESEFCFEQSVSNLY